MGQKKRRLTDLYVVGKEITFSDGSDEPITVFVRKLSPVDQEAAARRANAERARILTLRKEPESEEYADLLSRAIDFGGVEELIFYLNSQAIDEYRQAREAEYAADEEWSKDGYLQGLFDAWEDGLAERYSADNTDAEAARVFNEMKRLTDRIDADVEAESKRLSRYYESMSIDELRAKVTEELLTLTADSVWVSEYRKCEIWLGVRDNENRHERYFENRAEVDALSLEILKELLEAHRVLGVEPLEGKDSLRTDTSSVSSEQPATEERSTPSGQLVVTP